MTIDVKRSAPGSGISIMAKRGLQGSVSGIPIQQQRKAALVGHCAA